MEQGDIRRNAPGMDKLTAQEEFMLMLVVAEKVGVDEGRREAPLLEIPRKKLLVCSPCSGGGPGWVVE